MSIAFYMDQHIPRAITSGLRMRGVGILTTQEDDTARFSDPTLLDRATELGRVLFTFDDDLLSEATQRQRLNKQFSGVIYIHLQDVRLATVFAIWK